MKVKSVQYHKVFSLGNYENEKIGIEIDLEYNDDPVAAHYEAVKYVERSHQFQRQHPKYQESLKIVANPDDYTGMDVKRAKEFIEIFETNFAEYLGLLKQRLQA